MSDYLLLTRKLPPPFLGGAGRYLYNILRFMPPGTVVFTERSRAPDAPDLPGLRVIRRGYIRPYPAPDAPFVVRLLHELGMLVCWSAELLWLCLRARPRCLLAGEVFPIGVLTWLAKKLCGIPYVVFVYGEELTLARGIRRRAARRVCRAADRVIVISDFSRGLVQAWGVPPTHLVLARPGVEAALFAVRDAECVRRCRAELAPPDDKILLTVGRLTRRKGHAEVIAALPAVLQHVPKLRYVVVGDDRGEGSRLREQVRQLGLDEHVRFLGAMDEAAIPLLYNACDVFIMANRELDNRDTEGFGMVFIEANAAHKPVIGGTAGGVPDAVADGVSGLLVDPTDPDALCGAIVRLLQDEAYAHQLGEQGYARAVAHFGWEQTAEVVRRCLEEVSR